MISLVLALTVALVPDVGLSPASFAVGRTGGLHAALVARGHTVRLLPSPTAPTLQAAADALAPQLRGVDWVVGHGYGGTVAALATAQAPHLKGWIGLGAPLSFGGETQAARTLFAWLATAPAPQRTWLYAGDLKLGQTPLAGLLMTLGLPRDVRRTLLGQGLSPLPVALIGHIAQLGRSRHTPDRAATPLRALRSRPALRVYALLTTADGWAPAWLTDPVDLGVPNAWRHTITRANDHPGELGHIDLLVHPRAADEVFGRLITALESTR
jgi:hypothetical protein